MSAASLRLLYSSNAFWSTSGYGVQGGSLLPRLAELPEFGGEPGSLAGRQNIANFAWYGLEGGLHEVDGFRVYPRFDDLYGNDVLGAHALHFGANVVITLIDVWVLKDMQQVKPALWLPWLPIDHDPVPEQFIDAVAQAYLPLTYSQWGHRMLADAGVPNAYIPHGVEPGVYHVIPERDEVRKFKRWLTGDESCHLSVMCAANKGFPSRKWFEGQIEAWRDFSVGKNAKIYIHSLPMPIHGGVDFHILAKRLGIEGQLIFPHPYLYRLGYPANHLALVYNAADVLMSVSMSEGFGIPIIEAQACGCPVVVTDFSAMPELVEWGYKVKLLDRQLTGMHSYQAWPSKADMTDKLERLYEQWTMCGGEWPMAQRLKTSQAIHEKYSWDVVVATHWAPLMERLAEEAPVLDERFIPGGIPPVAPMGDSVADFVAAVNEGIAEQQVPQPRIAPYIVEPQPVEEPSIDVPLSEIVAEMTEVMDIVEETAGEYVEPPDILLVEEPKPVAKRKPRPSRKKSIANVGDEEAYDG